MKMPRTLLSADLVKALRREFGYHFIRMPDCHMRIRTSLNGTHNLTIPTNTELRAGTLRKILGEVASHHGLGFEEVCAKLFDP